MFYFIKLNAVIIKVRFPLKRHIYQDSEERGKVTT